MTWVAEEVAWVMIPKLDKDKTGCVLDVRPLVLCKDCIYWDKGHTEECDNSDSVCFHNGWCKPYWFCADGVEKDINVLSKEEGDGA